MSPAGADPGVVSPCDQSSLQSLIDAGGTISFATDCHLVLSAPLTVPIGTVVTITGTGHSVVLDGQDPTTHAEVRVLDVQGGSLTLEDLTVTNGAAIGVSGTRGLDGTDNTTVSLPGGDGAVGANGLPGQGGGLFIAHGATATVSGVAFSNDNAAGGIGGDGGDGGAGGCPSSADGTHCEALGSGYPAGDGGKAGNGGVGQGGAIYNAGGLTISGSTFDSDTASGGEGGDGGGGGTGGLGFGQGFFGGHGGEGNSAGNGANAQGGAVYSSGSLKISNSLFAMDGAAAGLGGGGGLGGAGGDGSYSINGPTSAGGGDGNNGGKGGNGGSAAGGAIWNSQNKGSLSGITYSHDTVAAGNLSPDCSEDFGLGCGGAGGPGGVGLQAPPNSTGQGPGPSGKDGTNGLNGASGKATNPESFSSSAKPLAIKTKSLSKATIHKTYTKTLSASGGSSPYSWTITGLPAGLGASDAGIISGAPTVVGTFNIDVQVTDPTDQSPTDVQRSLSLTVKGIKPKVTHQPANATVRVGATATFTATASGAPTPTLQWEISTNRGATFNPIPGATTSPLVVTDVTAAQNGDKYEAVFSNAAGTKASRKATLKVR